MTFNEFFLMDVFIFILITIIFAYGFYLGEKKGKGILLKFDIEDWRDAVKELEDFDLSELIDSLKTIFSLDFPLFQEVYQNIKDIVNLETILKLAEDEITLRGEL